VIILERLYRYYFSVDMGQKKHGIDTGRYMQLFSVKHLAALARGMPA
jgi:hypothetical protein